MYDISFEAVITLTDCDGVSVVLSTTVAFQLDRGPSISGHLSLWAIPVLVSYDACLAHCLNQNLRSNAEVTIHRLFPNICLV